MFVRLIAAIRRAVALGGPADRSREAVQDVYDAQDEIEFQSLDHYNYPPADLMIEVDMTHISLNKLPICAALGVPEHWRFDGEKLEIRVLKNGKYVEVNESAAFPKLPLKEALPKFIQ